MTRFLKRWGALGGASLAGAVVALLGVGLAQLARHDTTVRGDERQDGRIAAVELWERNHEEKVAPLIDKLMKIDRNLDSFLLWFRTIARTQGWPEPPAAVKRILPEPSGGGTYAAESPERQRSQK